MTLNFLNIIHVLLAAALIGFILVQRGPGATAGSAFGSGASSTVFGARGSGSFLTKTTAILATLFFALSMLMAVQANQDAKKIMQSGSDLGVVGSLSDHSEVPQLNPTIPADDVPAIDPQAAQQTAENDAVAAEPAGAVAGDGAVDQAVNPESVGAKTQDQTQQQETTAGDE